MSSQQQTFLPLYWNPQQRIIQSLTQGFPTTLVTTSPHQYLNGLKVRLFLPSNQFVYASLKGIFTVTVVNSTTFTIDLDSRGYPNLVIKAHQLGQVIAVGEVAQNLDQALKTNGYNVFP